MKNLILSLCHIIYLNCIFARLLTDSDFSKEYGKDDRRKQTRRKLINT